MAATTLIPPEVEKVGDERVRLAGAWSLRGLAPHLATIRRELADQAATPVWDLTGVRVMDSFGALLLWRAWGRRWPQAVEASLDARQALERCALAKGEGIPRPARFRPGDFLALVGVQGLLFARHLMDFIALQGQMVLELGHLLRDPRQWPLKEISANLYKVGVKAMPVTALVGFLIGVVLSYLSALQLKAFGADVFIVNILGLGIIRELGPVLVSVLVAGRSGSAMTAQLGVMRVTEEIDALATMGVSRHTRLVFPKIVALSCAMPLLVLWTSFVALLGGMVTADLQLDLGYGFFIQTLPRVVPIANLLIGLAKGAVFGLLIALVACHFGLRVKPNTESLSAHTTSSVVTAITVVILADAVFAIATRSIGIPG
ncbi:MAG: ABC transporter permease [Rhodocyclaceae bacterium]|jgi:phospholipid/cholesterol/gamma-HCH transport system permease protein|nr:ABC transporter permease [Rhodocyclaceae bacterium]